MVYTFYENLSDYRMAALENQRAVAQRSLETTQLRIKQKEDEIKSNSDAFGCGQQSTSTTTACTMSIGSIFKHCKQENVNNLKRQRRGARNKEVLEYEEGRVRAKTP